MIVYHREATISPPGTFPVSPHLFKPSATNTVTCQLTRCDSWVDFLVGLVWFIKLGWSDPVVWVTGYIGSMYFSGLTSDSIIMTRLFSLIQIQSLFDHIGGNPRLQSTTSYSKEKTVEERSFIAAKKLKGGIRHQFLSSWRMKGLESNNKFEFDPLVQGIDLSCMSVFIVTK
ncbi:hypothetical protein F2Q70_00003827 [Brassica cretica]|uniref:Uncharacterized protein n=1 Tax=Brassica cretica TaxID=69181 RepID=A0A8S9J2V4_BRACR|nr:hypothetical protein F2Q68_00021073 [Brassica cretica]KAF2576109.1 hypothetical protein F2Q70_00003827 [Brassica cretica]